MNANHTIKWKQISTVLAITIAASIAAVVASYLAGWLHADEFSILAALFGMLGIASSVEERLRQRH